MRSPPYSPALAPHPHRLSAPSTLAAAGAAAALMARHVDTIAPRVTVGDLMTAAPPPLQPADALSTAAERLEEAEAVGVAAVFVIAAAADARWPVGVFGREELGVAWRLGLAAHTQVEAVMNPFVLAVSRAAPLGRGIALMAFDGGQVLAVLDAHRRLVGVLSALDVLRWMSLGALRGAWGLATPAGEQPAAAAGLRP